MRFVNMVAVVAVLASGAEARAQGYDNILIHWSPPAEVFEPFNPEAVDIKGELLFKSTPNVWGHVWSQVPDALYNNHNQRDFVVGEYQYMLRNRIPSPIEDDWSLGGSLHHYDGSLDFHSGRRYWADASVTQSWEPEDWGIIQIPLSADHEGHELKLNGETIFKSEMGRRFTGEIYALIMEGNEELRLEWSGKNDAADIRISPAKFYPQTYSVPEPSLGGLIDAIGSGIGGLIGW